MPNLRDTVIVFMEDLVEAGIDSKIDEDTLKRAGELLEVLEDMRDGYGNHTWDEEN